MFNFLVPFSHLRGVLLRFSLVVPTLCALSLTGCKQDAASTAPDAPEVQVIEVIQKDVPIFSEWVGTTDGHVNAQIRAQVSGYLMRRTYREGAFVKKGTVLFELDPSKFKAELDEAKGDLAKVKAQLVKTKLDVKRDLPLAKQGAISQKELADSIQSYSATKASVAAAIASLEQARLNLKWTRITAPIDGIVGIAEAQVGDLIEQSTLLTSMSTLDPLRVYFPISEQEYLRAAKRINQHYEDAQNTNPNSTSQSRENVELILSDGSVYPYKGRLFLSDLDVSSDTGTIRTAALFRNPNNILRPGQYARVRVLVDTKKEALLVPQRAVTELQGSYQVAVVTSNSTIEIKPVKVAERFENLWIVEDGLHPNDRVVVEGIQKLKAGMTVTPQPFEDMNHDQ